MLKSLEVKGFKLFNHLQVQNLARLNLFVGSNNAGKTCLLEALRLYTSRGTLEGIQSVIRSGDADWSRSFLLHDRLSEDNQKRVESSIRFLFTEEDPKKLLDQQIKIRSEDPSRNLTISLGWYRSVESEDGSVRRVQIEAPEVESSDDLTMEVLVGSERKIFNLKNFWRRQSSFHLLAGPDSFSISPISVGTGGLDSNEVASLWNQIDLTPAVDKVLVCLRLIEPRIEALSMLSDNSRSSQHARIPVVRLKGSQERMPLRNMGDGLTRLFHIALALVNAQNGTVLIDEFENGLYWEVQERLWPYVFDLAEELNVQLFATTHSRDSLEAFVSAWSNRPDLASLLRLEKGRLGISVFSMPLPNLQDAVSSEIEVR